MEKYKILKIQHDLYEFIVISYPYNVPFKYLENISEDIKLYNIKGCNVIFDMLLSMGNTSERFVEVFFNGENFSEDTFKYVNIRKKDEIRKISLNYLSQGICDLEYSILTSVQKKMINKGIAI